MFPLLIFANVLVHIKIFNVTLIVLCCALLTLTAYRGNIFNKLDRPATYYNMHV